MRRRRAGASVLLAAAALVAAPSSALAEDLVLPLDAEGPGWKHVRVIADGAHGRAASFGDPLAVVDAGPCPISSSEAFTLVAWVRTRDAGFSTAVMAREPGGSVGLALVMGREPGRISFEAWSWASVRLVSRTRVDDGAWHRVEATYDPASRAAALFVDDRAEATGELGVGAAPRASLRLGNNIGADQPFRGDLDEVAVLRRTTHADRFAGLAPVLTDDARRASLAALRDQLLPRATAPPKDAATWAARRLEVRRGIADALGLSPAPARRPLDARVHGALDGDGFRVERTSWASSPGLRATGWLWTPRPRREGRGPAVLSPHGHWAGGAIDPVVQARAASLARQGYVVLVPDSVHVEDVASGVSAIGVMTWNNVRGLDLLLERDDVDPARVGVTGASGGGQQTMVLMALEDRLAAAAPICMVSYLGELLFDDFAHCTCNHAPRVAVVADEPEMCAVFAPRPAFFGSITGDWTRKFESEGLPEIRRVYRLLGHEERVASMHRDEGHNYGRGFREAVYGFFRRTLLEKDGAVVEAPFTPIPLPTLLALGPAPTDPDPAALARDFMARRPRVAELAEVAPGLPWSVARAPLEDLGPAAAGSAWRRAAVKGPDGVSVPMLLRDGGDGSPETPWTVVTSPAGKAVLRLDAPAWLEKAHRVALVDPRFSGEWRPFAAAWRRNGLLLGRGEGYEAAHDLALACESLPGSAPVTLVALDAAGVVALIAARLSPRIRTVVATDLGPRFAEDGNRLPFCPEILRFGDLPALVASIAAPRTLVLGGVHAAGDFRAAADVRLALAAEPLGPDAVAAALGSAAGGR